MLCWLHIFLEKMDLCVVYTSRMGLAAHMMRFYVEIWSFVVELNAKMAAIQEVAPSLDGRMVLHQCR